MKKLKILGVCQGQGALLFPLKKYVVGNIEPRGCFHTPKEEQWKINFGEIPFVRSYEEFIKHYEGKIDVILSSANCGASSVLSYSRKKSLGKPKEDATITLLIEMIKLYKPKLFILENLPRLLDLFPLTEWEEILPDYEFIVHNHSVMEFGNSQKSRKRLILIGFKKKLSSKFKNVFTNVFQVNTPKFTRELLECSRQYTIFNYHEANNKKVPMYDYREKEKGNLTLKQIKKLWTTDFKDHYKWPVNSARMKTLPGVYRNHLDKYPMTVRPSSRQFNPDGSIMGIRDYLVIQGFPNKFKVYIDEDNLGYWINKARIALTKGPVYEIGLWIKKNLSKI